MNKLLLIDGNSLTYRAYFGSAYGPRGILKTSDGLAVNAVLTLNRMLEKAFRQYKPTHILIAFDAGPKTIRHEKLPSYKAGRQKTPQELIDQFPIVKDMITKMGIKQYELDLIEADDIIATLAKKIACSETEVIVMSSDRDLFQLVQENITIAVPQNGTKPNDSINIEEFFNRFGYSPNQVKDVKGLVGDPSDNLPGVKGIGEKGAVKLLNQYNTLEGIYDNIENISGSVRDKLIKDKEMAFLCKDIATLIYDVNIPYAFEEMEYKNMVSQEFIDFIMKYELNSLLRHYNVKFPEVEELNKEVEIPKKIAKDVKKIDFQMNFDNILF